MDHKFHIIQIIHLVKDLLDQTPHANQKIESINSNGEHSIAMDLKIENAVVEYIKTNELPYKIFAEEGGDIEVCTNPQFYITFDPLDGSTNYSFGKNLLPYGFLISIYNNLNPKISDVITAGAFEYTTKQMWIFNQGKTYSIPSNTEVSLDDVIHPDLHTPVYIDLYRKKSYDFYGKIAEKVFIRNTGSTIGNLNLTLSKASTMLAGSIIKPEEIGSLYALIKGAGGKVTDESGEDLGNISFSSNRSYDVIAGNPGIVDFTLQQLRT